MGGWELELETRSWQWDSGEEGRAVPVWREKPALAGLTRVLEGPGTPLGLLQTPSRWGEAAGTLPVSKPTPAPKVVLVLPQASSAGGSALPFSQGLGDLAEVWAVGWCFAKSPVLVYQQLSEPVSVLTKNQTKTNTSQNHQNKPTTGQGRRQSIIKSSMTKAGFAKTLLQGNQ